MDYFHPDAWRRPARASKGRGEKMKAAIMVPGADGVFYAAKRKIWAPIH
jgi:hypothetical protein